MALGDGGNDIFTMDRSFPFPSTPRGSLVVGANRLVAQIARGKVRVGKLSGRKLVEPAVKHRGRDAGHNRRQVVPERAGRETSHPSASTR